MRDQISGALQFAIVAQRREESEGWSSELEIGN